MRVIFFIQSWVLRPLSAVFNWTACNEGCSLITRLAVLSLVPHTDMSDGLVWKRGRHKNKRLSVEEG